MLYEVAPSVVCAGIVLMSVPATANAATANTATWAEAFVAILKDNDVRLISSPTTYSRR